MGYPKGNLTTRAVVKPWSYTVIPPEGRVKNVLPFFEGFSTTILASPKYGANFVFVHTPAYDLPHARDHHRREQQQRGGHL